MATISCRPVTRSNLDDLLVVFGEQGASCGCWCMYWRISGDAFASNGNDGNRAALLDRIRRGEVPGVLAYVDGVPVGWCSVAPRDTFREVVPREPSGGIAPREPCEASRDIAAGDTFREAVPREPSGDIVPREPSGGVASVLCEDAAGEASRGGLSGPDRNDRDDRNAVDGTDIWSITCFYIPRSARHMGVAAALVRGAVEHACAGGARVVEAYPSPVASEAAYMGTVSMFANAGFHDTDSVYRYEIGSR